MLKMSNIDELTNEFDVFSQLYEKEEDPKVKDVLIKHLLEIAKAVGSMALKDQTSLD
ncbi:MAG: hypothetical protein A4E54_01709 [Pelotomaculum sp. PtaB.Bin117]|nr:MAG: hypothetical protein A4E54_01709 [Pelotomaculum sp. PtaB.Bin117]OPY61071.1 MAG: hypothetical protein A4E56_02273 [Pelotomaculum sp. PtaU1.Bin065]